MEKNEHLEKLLEIKQTLDEVLATKQEQLEHLQKEIEDLKSIDNKISALVSGASFTTAADLLGKLPPVETKTSIKGRKKAPSSDKESSAQWEKYVYDEEGELLAKLVYDAGTTTIYISRPEDVKIKKDTPMFQDFFIQKILITMKEESPSLTLDFQETSGGFLRQISISQMGSEENFAKIERAIEHVLKKVS